MTKEQKREYYRTHKYQWEQYRKSHKKELAKYMKKYKKNYKRTHRKQIKKYNKIYNKIYRQKHKEELKEYQKIYHQTHKKQIRVQRRKYIREYQKNRCKRDMNYKLAICLRSRLYSALKGINKSQSTLKLIGCSIEQLKQHLEMQFKPGMSFDNYGKWHIDHIRPCASFDLSKSEEQYKCFHYTNLQPLWAYDNLSKNDKVTGE